MANLNRPFGLRPVRYLSGAPYSGANNYYHVPASNAVALFSGDPMIMTGNANNTAYRDFPPGTLADVGVSAAPPANTPVVSYAQFIMGSLVARLPETRESNIYVPVGIESIVMVDEDPMIVYRIQDNGAAVLGPGAAGLNANIIAGNGSTASGQSGYMLDAGSVSSPSTGVYQLTILRASNIIGNDATAAYCVWDVIINTHPFGAPTIGI